MALTPDQLLAALRAEGVRVSEAPGWRDRGYDTLDPRFVVNHHTVGGTGPTDQRDVDEMIRGRPDLEGPLCNFLLGKDGTVHLVAFLRARHAGPGARRVFDEVSRGVAPSGDARARGFKDSDKAHGNRHSWGIEVDHPGDDTAYPPVQVEALVRLNAALCRLGGWTADRCIHHREWTRRKIDMSMRADLRALVAARLRPAPAVPTFEETPMKYAKADVRGTHPERGKVYAVTAQGRTWMKSGFEHMDWLADHGLGPARNPATGEFDIEKWPVQNLLTFPLLGES